METFPFWWAIFNKSISRHSYFFHRSLALTATSPGFEEYGETGDSNGWCLHGAESETKRDFSFCFISNLP